MIHCQLHRQGARYRSFSVIFSMDGGPKDDKNRIANELINRALVMLDHVDHLSQITIEHDHDLLWRQAARHRGEATEIRHYQGDLAPLSSQL